MGAKIKVVQKENAEPIPTEIIAQSIKEIAEGMKALKSSRLTKRAVLVLVRDSCNESLATIERVLNSLEDLERTYLK